MEPAARGRLRKWVGGASGEEVEIPEKEIESEWAEWQTGLAEQQAGVCRDRSKARQR